MTTELKITGMTCAHCERAVQTALEAVPGVSSVRVDRNAGSATVSGDAAVADLVAAVAEEGYSAEAAQA